MNASMMLMLWAVAALVLSVVWPPRTQARRAADAAWFDRDSSALATALLDSASVCEGETARTPVVL
jgi:hypothetical protein